MGVLEAESDISVKTTVTRGPLCGTMKLVYSFKRDGLVIDDEEIPFPCDGEEVWD